MELKNDKPSKEEMDAIKRLLKKSFPGMILVSTIFLFLKARLKGRIF